jgi:hypothetical protein
MCKGGFRALGRDVTMSGMRHRPLPRLSAPPRRERRPAGVSVAGSFVGSFLAVTSVHVLALPSFVGLLAVAVVVGACSIDATWPATTGVVVLGWLFLDGFVANAYGELHLHGAREEWWLALLVAVAVATVAASRLVPGVPPTWVSRARAFPAVADRGSEPRLRRPFPAR